MKTGHSKFLKTTELCLLGSLVLVCIFYLIPEAKADGYSECNQILSQDIFNRVITSDSSNSASASQTKASFYSQKDTEAYEAYKAARREAHENGTKINAEFHYGIIGGELGIDVNSKDEVSSEDFKQKFNKSKEKYGKSSESKTASSQNLASNYASYVRDPGTVQAWRECVTKSKETNIYTFASRDAAGKAYVNVVWAPGRLEATVPRIHIRFVTDDDPDGVKIHANAEEEIAAGTGSSFAVSCGTTKCDNGFQVVVNGTLKDAAGKTNSFTSTVDVPPLTPPVTPDDKTELTQMTPDELSKEWDATRLMLKGQCTRRNYGDDCPLFAPILAVKDPNCVLDRKKTDTMCFKKYKAFLIEEIILGRQALNSPEPPLPPASAYPPQPQVPYPR